MTDAAPYFVDTAYLQAVINTRDQWYPAAARWEAWLAAERHPLVTTEFVLIEFGDSLATIKARSLAAGMIDVLRGSSLVETVPASAELFDAALTLYRNRADKGWGLTDCSSFVTMRERRLTAALTADDHFRQAGFRALLLEEVPR